MSNDFQPNVANDIIRIHKVITRAMNVSIDNISSIGQKETIIKDGFLHYLQCLVTVVDGHHITEDEIGFPYFRKKIPEVPYDDLILQHKMMVIELKKMTDAINSARGKKTIIKPVATISQALSRLMNIWEPHIRVEEKFLTAERLGSLLSTEEQEQIGMQFAKYGQEHAKPEPLVIPFILYNLQPQEREIMSKMLPPVITEQLVPFAWKEQWSSMKPFLLE